MQFSWIWMLEESLDLSKFSKKVKKSRTDDYISMFVWKIYFRVEISFEFENFYFRFERSFVCQKFYFRIEISFECQKFNFRVKISFLGQTFIYESKSSLNVKFLFSSRSGIWISLKILLNSYFSVMFFSFKIFESKNGALKGVWIYRVPQ